jgi:hypothetical protein
MLEREGPLTRERWTRHPEPLTRAYISAEREFALHKPWFRETCQPPTFAISGRASRQKGSSKDPPFGSGATSISAAFSNRSSATPRSQTGQC